MSYAIREAIAAFRRAPVLTGLSAAMVGLALFVVGLFGLVAYNLQVALEEVEERVEVVAYLRDDIGQGEVQIVRTELTTDEAVEEVAYVSKEEALARARRIPELAEAFEEVQVNPLPASIEVTLLEGSRTQESVERIAALVGGYPFVEDVDYGREWVEKLFTLRRVAGITAGALGAAFAVVAALIIGTALRIAILARRDEIRIMRLVGAKDSFVRRPFVLEGLVVGLFGGVAALLLTRVLHGLVNHYLFEIDWLPFEWMVVGLAAGALFGVLASRLSVGRHLAEI